MPVVDCCLEQLKKLVLTKNAIPVMVPQCAKHISGAILLQTRRQLSEVAILRLFDFVPAKFPPSDYTKDILSIYCGYENYTAFCRNFERFNQSQSFPKE